MALWTPTLLGAALCAQWKADAIGGLSDGDPISTWTDTTSGAYALTQTGSARPTYKTNIQNGLPVARFASASSQFLAVSSVFGISAQPFSIAAVWSHGGNAQALCQFNNDTGGCYTTGATTLGWNCGAGITIACSQAVHVTVGVGNGASSLIAVDGTVTTGSAGTRAPTGGFKVGSERTGTSFFLNGDIGEIIVTNTALSTTDRQTLEGYLAYKWGLTASLPSNHPYKTDPPRVWNHSGLRYPLGAGLRNRTLRG